MMSPVRLTLAVLVLAAVAHAQFFPIQFPYDPYEIADRIQRMAQPQFSGASASSSSSSSSSSGPIHFGGGGFNQGFNGGYNQGFQESGYFPPGQHEAAYNENFGDHNNGGSLGIRLGQGSVQVGASQHSSGPGSSGSFVSSSSATDSDGKIHYNVQSGRF